VTRPEESLAARLRDLRVTVALTQKDVGRALGVSVPLLSSWENGNAMPPLARLDAYARLFALAPPGPGVRPLLPELSRLSGPELERYEGLLRELTELRGGAAEPAVPLAPHPLRFPVGQAITVVCSELDTARRSKIGYADPQSPDFVESYKYADLDALIALLPHVGVLNPASEIAVGTWDELSADDRTAHLIALGGVDFNKLMRETLRELSDVPVGQLGRSTDDDIGGFRIREPSGVSREIRPKVEALPPAPGEERPARAAKRPAPGEERVRLVEDVAHFLRAPNPFNRERTITFFGGMFSRGSLGVVRALTDPKLKERNASYLARRFGTASTYSIVCRVPIFIEKVVVPDWNRPDSRLHEWPPPDREPAERSADPSGGR
jgi:transcriptional regulator with XRE-family HTH domain